MFSALEHAARLKPEIRLAQAVSQFEADLSNEQKATFRTLKSQSLDSPPGPSDVMRLTAEIDRQVSRQIGNRCLGPRFTNFLQGVQQFAALGDVVVGGSQNIIACGVWSLAIINFSSYVEKVSTLFMDLGRSTPRYQTIALLYSRSKSLQCHLSEYFVVVVRFCHQLLRFSQKSTFRQVTSTLSDSNIKAFQSELDLWANSIKEEISLLVATKIEEEARESSQFRALSSEHSKSVSYRQKLATNLRVLDLCSMYDHETTWKQTRKVGNAFLFQQVAEYQAWRDTSGSCTLLYTGKLGAGKSVLLANIVDDLNIHIGNNCTAVAYFFCRHDIPESLKARTVLGSLARQLLRPIPDLAMVAEVCDETSSTEDTEKVLDLLHHALAPGHKAYFVLDGLDEYDHSERAVLTQGLQRLQKTLNLLLCVSLRVEPNSRLDLITEQFGATRIASIPDNNPDIEAFIEGDLERCLENQKLVIGDPTLILEIQDALLKGSQGMFLWVALQIQSLCGMKTDQAIRDALADLPKDLSETFARILRKSRSPGQSYQTKILQLVSAAYRPLTATELREALSVVPGDTIWNPSRLLNDIYSALACCGCLLIVDEEERTVRFVHHSVKQFVLNGCNNSNNNVAFTVEKAQRTIADIVVTYLNYGIFGTELSRTKVPPVMIQSAQSSMIHAAIGSSSTVRGFALKLLKSRKRPDFDISKVLAGARKPFQLRPADEFRFYSYAISYWLHHIFYVSGQEMAMYNLSVRLIETDLLEANTTARDDWI
ncbi:hypothetical protein GQ44DRAFT_675817, partial [Phaeosphaeriaceae sp. PMI808]